MPMIGLLVGAGMGLLNAGEQQLQANKQSKIAAATIAYSPWTHANINDAQASIHPAQFAANTGMGALTGWAAGQGKFAGTGGDQTVNVEGRPQQAPGTTTVSDGKGGLSPYDASKWAPDNSPNPPAPQGNVGGQYGYGPAPGTMTQGPSAGYGAPWSPYQRAMYSGGGS